MALNDEWPHLVSWVHNGNGNVSFLLFLGVLTKQASVKLSLHDTIAGPEATATSHAREGMCIVEKHLKAGHYLI